MNEARKSSEMVRSYDDFALDRDEWEEVLYCEAGLGEMILSRGEVREEEGDEKWDEARRAA